MSVAWFRSTASYVVSMVVVLLGLAACGSGGDLGPDPGVAPSITTQPSSTTADDGSTATFNVIAVGDAGLTYQWQRNGTAIPGATLSVYTTPTLTLADSGAVYAVVVTNTAGSVTSNPATLTVVQAAARITTQPADSSVLDGDAATFSVAVTGGTPPITYQWFRRAPGSGEYTPATGTGSTSASYTTDANAMSDSGAVYRVTITAAGGAVNSRDAMLTVAPRPPAVTTQPTAAPSVQFQAGTSLSVAASGTAPLSYQWYRNGIALSGETGTTLTLGSANYGDDGARYTAVVTNGGGSASSQAAVLTVTPPVGGLQIVSGCLTINGAGVYQLGMDIGTNVANSTCVSITPNVSNVQIDCNGHTISASGTNAIALAISDVQNVSVKRCTIASDRLPINRVTNVSIHGNTFPAGPGLTGIEVNHATLLAFDSNTVAQGYFNQTYGQAVTVSNNNFTASAGTSSLLALVWSRYGTATRVTGNTLEGRWNSDRGNQTQNGAHSGIDIHDESDVVIDGNVMTNIFACGVQFLGNVALVTARDNRITNAGQCGFIGSQWFSLSASRFEGNVVDRSAVAFHFFREGGLRAAGFDPEGSRPADSAVRFRDIVIERNTLSNAVSSDGSTTPPTVVILPITTRMNYGSAGPGETEPGTFDLGNVRFTRNTFDRNAAPIEFGQGAFTANLIVDGGGNVCRASAQPGFPLVCN